MKGAVLRYRDMNESKRANTPLNPDDQAEHRRHVRRRVYGAWVCQLHLQPRIIGGASPAASFGSGSSPGPLECRY